jgi:hypothetical protein
MKPSLTVLLLLSLGLSATLIASDKKLPSLHAKLEESLIPSHSDDSVWLPTLGRGLITKRYLKNIPLAELSKKVFPYYMLYSLTPLDGSRGYDSTNSSFVLICATQDQHQQITNFLDQKAEQDAAANP